LLNNFSDALREKFMPNFSIAGIGRGMMAGVGGGMGAAIAALTSRAMYSIYSADGRRFRICPGGRSDALFNQKLDKLITMKEAGLLPDDEIAAMKSDLLKQIM